MKTREVRNALLGLLIVLGLVLPVTVGSQGRAAKAIGDPDPSLVSSYAIVIDGVEIGRFSEISLRTGWELEDLEVTSRRLQIGNRMPPSVHLRRGHSSSMDIWAWHVAALANAEASRRNAAIVIYDFEGAPVARYNLTAAWPAKVEIGALKAGASEVLMETVTIVCESIQRVSV